MTDAEYDQLYAQHNRNAVRINELADAEYEAAEANGGSTTEDPEKRRLVRENDVILRRLQEELEARFQAGRGEGDYAIDCFAPGGHRIRRIVMRGTRKGVVQHAQSVALPGSVNFIRVVLLAGQADGLEVWSERRDV